MFKESSKSRGVFRTQASIYDKAFLWICLTTYYFCNKSSVTDVRLCYVLASENIYFQSEAKFEQIVAIVATHSVFLFSLAKKRIYLGCHSF